MIERITDNQKPCSYCTQYGHTAFKCGRKAQAKAKTGTYNGLKISSSFGGKRKPMKKIGKVTKTWIATRKEWLSLNPPPYFCYICKCPLEEKGVQLDHVRSRARAPELRFVLSNLKPICPADNERKGSRDYINGELV